MFIDFREEEENNIDCPPYSSWVGIEPFGVREATTNWATGQSTNKTF